MMNPDSAPAPTTRQREILQFIRDTLQERGAPPTREEIARAFGFRSLNAAEQHLQALARKGLIELVAGTSRGIRLRDMVTQLKDTVGRELGLQGDGLRGLPLIGKVAAGSPILAQENLLRQSAVDPQVFTPRADYLLEVRGMSMRDAGILDGDWLAVHRQAEARHGQIVVARLGDEVTVKRLHKTGTQIQLLPENPEFKPILVHPHQDAFAIEGLAVGVIRPTL